MRSFLPAWAVAALVTAVLPGRSSAVIYGTDDRIEAGLAAPEIRALADATALVLTAADVRVDALSGTARLAVRTFGEKNDLSSGERFRDEPSVGDCSSALVGPDLLITAAHCVEGKNPSDLRFVFGYRVAADGRDPANVSARDVYGARAVIAEENAAAPEDWALVRLDRAVVGRTPLEVEPKSASAGQDVLLIGYPGGLPVKVAGGAKVTAVSAQGFTANLDAYVNESGGPVFDVRTRRIVGILVTGEDDFEAAPSDGNAGGRKRSRVLDDAPGKEVVVAASAFLAPLTAARLEGTLPSGPVTWDHAPRR